MLHFLLLVALGQFLAALSNAQQDLANGQAKYNGPSHQYLPTVAENKKVTLPSTRESLQQYQSWPKYNELSLQTQNSQPQTTGEAEKHEDDDFYAVGPYHLQQFTELKPTTVAHSTIAPSYYRSPDELNKLSYNPSVITGRDERFRPSTFQQQQETLYHEPSRKSYLAFTIPAPTNSMQPQTPPPQPTEYQEVKPHNDPPRKSQLSFIIPEITSPEPPLNRDTVNQSGAVEHVKGLQVPSQQYLPPLHSSNDSLRPQESKESAKTASLSNTSRYHGPSHQYLPVTTEASNRLTSFPFYASKSQTSGSYPNNRPWNPIKAVPPRTTPRLQTGTSPVALHRGYRYNTPAQSHTSPNAQTINGVNYNELGMGLNCTSKDQDIIDFHTTSEGKTEIQTEQGYVYGQTDSSSNNESQAITHLKPVTTIPSSYHYYTPGQSFEENRADPNQVQYQTLQEYKGSESGMKEEHSGEGPSSGLSKSATNSFMNRNETKEVYFKHKPIQIRQDYDGSLDPTSGGSEQHRHSTGPAQYQQQPASKLYPNQKKSTGNCEKSNTLITLQSSVESSGSKCEKSTHYIPSFRSEEDEQQIRLGYYPAKPGNQEGNTNLNFQHTLQKSVKIFSPTTGYPTDHRPSSGPNYSEQQFSPNLSRPAVQSDVNMDLNSQTLESSIPLGGSSAYGSKEYDQHSRPNFISSSPENINMNGINDLPQNQLETNGNVRPSSEASSDNRPFGNGHYEQQQNKAETNRYYPTDSETYQPAVSANTPSSNDVTQSATPSFLTTPYHNLQYSPHQQHFPFHETQENNSTSKSTQTDAQRLSASNQFPSPPQNSHSWLTTLPNSQQTLSHNSYSSNISPIPQEELQKYYTNKKVSLLPPEKLLPTATKPEFHKYFLAGQDNFSAIRSQVLNQNSLNSNLLPEPRNEYQMYPTYSQVTDSTHAKNPLHPNSQGQFPQLLSGFTPLETSFGYTTSQYAKSQQYSHLDRNSSFQGSLVFPYNRSLFHTNSGNLRTLQPQISQKNPSGSLAEQYNQLSQSPPASSSEIYRPSSQSPFSFNSNNGLTNSKPSLQYTREYRKPSPLFAQIPQSLAGSTHFSLEFQGNRPNHKEIQSFSSSLPQTEAQKLISSYNQTAKHFLHHNVSRNQASYQQQQQFFLGNPATTFEDPRTSSVSNFFGSSASIPHTASSTIGNESNLNSSETLTSSPEFVNSVRNQNFLETPAHPYSYYTIYPGHSAQGQQFESLKQQSNPNSQPKPMDFVDSPLDITTSPVEPSQPMVLIESPPLASQQILVRSSHLVYGSPIGEPSNGYLPPSVAVQPPYLKK